VALCNIHEAIYLFNASPSYPHVAYRAARVVDVRPFDFFVRAFAQLHVVLLNAKGGELMPSCSTRP
jgi:hypothetical protein